MAIGRRGHLKRWPVAVTPSPLAVPSAPLAHHDTCHSPKIPIFHGPNAAAI